GISIWIYPPALYPISSGISTTNSLIKEATLKLRTTLAFHFLIPNTASGIVISMSCFTFTWQARRIPSDSSFFEKWGVSVGRADPPPESTWHSHWMQVPPPPQAEGRNIFLAPKVESREFPEETSTFFSPLIVMVTGPEGDNFSLVNNSRATNNNNRTKKATTAMTTVPAVLTANIILIYLRLQLRYRRSSFPFPPILFCPLYPLRHWKWPR